MINISDEDILLASLETNFWTWSAQGKVNPIPVKRAEGVYFWDVHGKKYFEAHEELEIAWRAEKGALRHVYRGILQIGLAYYHILRGNYRGAVKMFTYSRYWLSPFPDICCGIQLGKLRQDALQSESTLLQLGEAKISQFPHELFKPVVMEQSEE
jgi:hypothetical protein